VCSAGFKTTTASVGFALICGNAGEYDAPSIGETLACEINVCNGTVNNQVVNADYGSCASTTTGGTCTPVCSAGFKTTTASVGFALICGNTGEYDAPSIGETLACEINICDGIVHNKGANFNYSSCASSFSGDICTPVCSAGCKTIVASAGFAVVCGDTGDYDAPSSGECMVNNCMGTVHNGIAGANYSECAITTTGATCLPVCLVNFTSTGHSNGFELVCNDDGGYDAIADSGRLACLSRNFSSGTPRSSQDQSRHGAVIGATCTVLFCILVVLVLLKIKSKKGTIASKITPGLFTKDLPRSRRQSYESNCDDDQGDIMVDAANAVSTRLQSGFLPTPHDSAMRNQFRHSSIDRHSSGHSSTSSFLSMKAARRSTFANANMHNQLGYKIGDLQTRASKLVGSTDPSNVLQMEQSIAKLEQDIRCGIDDIISADAVAEYKRQLRLTRERLHSRHSLDAQLKNRLVKQISGEFDSVLVAPPSIACRPSAIERSSSKQNGVSPEGFEEVKTPALSRVVPPPPLSAPWDKKIEGGPTSGNAAVVFQWGTYLSS
jgi:hypothetical protein